MRATGAIEPINRVEISSELSGTVKDVLVDFNSEVKAGDVDALADTSHVQGRANLLPHQIFNTHKS